MARRAQINKIKEDAIAPFKAAIKDIRIRHNAAYKEELEAIKAKDELNDSERVAEEVRQLLLGLISAAKANPDKFYLFDDRVFHNKEPRWQPLRDLANKELGGYYEAGGYFVLQATTAQIACHWVYENLRWEPADEDRYKDDTGSIIEIPLESSNQPVFYLNDTGALEIKNPKKEIDISFCSQELYWEGEVPGEQDIDWDENGARVDVYGKAVVPLAIYTLRKGGPAKCVYA